MEKLEFVRGENGDVSVLIDGEAHTIGAEEWIEVVASVSHAGVESVRRGLVRMFHQGVDEVAGLVDATLHLHLDGRTLTGRHMISGTEATGAHQPTAEAVLEPVKPEPVLAPAPVVEEAPVTETTFVGASTEPGADKTTAEKLLDNSGN